MKTEIRHQMLDIGDLQAFEKAGVPLGPKLGEKLEVTTAHLVCCVRREEANAAIQYGRIIGRTPDNFTPVVCDDPLATARAINLKHTIPLVVTSAIDPALKELMFQNPDFGELLADRFPLPNPQNLNVTPILHCVGITKHGIETLTQESHAPNQIPTSENPEGKRSDRLKAVLGNIVTPMDFQNILRSRLVKEVNIHALGPAGTNISQAAHLYIERVGISDKTNVIVHGFGITPLEYAEIAAEETRKSLLAGELPKILHLHMECAVFDGLGKLYQQRSEESIFIDEQDMALDSMQLAAQLNIDELRSIARGKGKIRIATHPSPRSLILSWINQGTAHWIEASSNSAAALMVTQDQADACVTTASTVTLLAKQNMHTLHQFGSPNMIFTIASPLSHRLLREFLSRGENNL